MYYEEFKDMTKFHPEGTSESGRYEIKHVQAKEPDAFDKIRNPEFAGQKDQLVCVLRDNEKREIVMSDSWMEQHTNIEFVETAEGDVLVAGLGIGMILLALQEKPEVKSITIVEISQELVDFIAPNLPLNDKVNIVVEDIHNFTPDKMYDIVYCDIWNDISGSNYDEMNELSEKFYHHSDRGVLHWRYDRTEELYEEDQWVW